MNILIIAAHGSRKETSNREVAELARKLSGKLSHMFDRVTHAFLQFADPLLAQELSAHASRGAKKIVVFPFFIGSGSHILTDIPDLVEKTKRRHPNTGFEITRHLGSLETIEDVIIKEVIKNAS